MDEFQKKMQLLDPGYVAPQSERVQNRQPIDFKPGPAKNEAGLEILPDTPVNSAMQKLYIDRMMQKDSMDKLQEDADRTFYADPKRAEMIRELGLHVRGGIPELNPNEEKELETVMVQSLDRLNPRQKLMREVFTDELPQKRK